MRPFLALLLLTPLLAGCLDAPAPVAPASMLAGAAGLAFTDVDAPAAQELRWTVELTGQRGSTCLVVVCVASPERPPCGEADCDVRALRLDVPEGHWVANEGGLRVLALFGEEWNVSGRLRVLDAQGGELARGGTGWFAAVAYLPEPEPGEVLVEMHASWGEGPIELIARLESAPRQDAPRDLLPNLVTRTPTDLQVARWEPELVRELTGIRGCGHDEIIEQHARRCLRFSNEVGNAGPGALEVRMSAANTAAGLIGRGEWMQRVYASDGAWREEPVGAAVFHAMHMHYHYQGLAHYTIHHYDLETRTRGEPLNEGQKAGFCFLDSGIVDPALPVVAPATYDGAGCLSPREQGENFMGMSAGWYDLYVYHLSEQYVDISGAPDGVYELVSTANAEGTLLETDTSDNSASVLFRLTGDEVEVLGPP